MLATSIRQEDSLGLLSCSIQQSSEIGCVIIRSFSARLPVVTLGLISAYRGGSKLLIPVKKRFVLLQSLSSYVFRCFLGRRLGVGGLCDGYQTLG